MLRNLKQKRSRLVCWQHCCAGRFGANLAYHPKSRHLLKMLELSTTKSKKGPDIEWASVARNEGSVYNVAVNPETGTVAAMALESLVVLGLGSKGMWKRRTQKDGAHRRGGSDCQPKLRALRLACDFSRMQLKPRPAICVEKKTMNPSVGHQQPGAPTWRLSSTLLEPWQAASPPGTVIVMVIWPNGKLQHEEPLKLRLPATAGERAGCFGWRLFKDS